MVGAAAGAIIGRFADNKVKTGLHDKLGEAMKPGTAAIIAMFDDDQRLGVEQALPGALVRSIAQTDKSGDAALKDSLAEAMGKFSPTAPCCRSPTARSAAPSAATWTRRWATGRSSPAAAAPEGAPNVLLILIDDAGFGGPDTFGGEIRTPASRASSRWA